MYGLLTGSQCRHLTRPHLEAHRANGKSLPSWLLNGIADVVVMMPMLS
jgi:hypothetical protein